MATQVKTDLIANNAITDAKIANVAITGVTASSGDSSTALATTAFVAGEINNLIDSAPGALNTLNELAAAMGDDANFSTTITNSIATKLPLAGGTLTGNLKVDASFTVNGNVDTSASLGEVLQLSQTDSVGGFLWSVDRSNNSYKTMNYHAGQHKFYSDASNLILTLSPTNNSATFAGRIQPNEHIIFQNTTGYLQFPGASSRAWAIASSGGNTSPGYNSASFGFHHWSGSAWTNPINITASGKLGVGTDNPNRLLSVVQDTTITAGFNDISEFLDTTIGAGGSVSLNIGRANSTKNLGKMAFKYAGSGSNSNALNFGFYDADNLMTLTAAGNVDIGKASFSSYPTGSKLNVYADGEGIRLDGTGNTTRRIRFRNVGAGTGPGEIVADGSLRIINEDANAYLSLESVRNIEYKVTSTNATAGHHMFSSYNTEIMRIDGANNRVGIMANGAPQRALQVGTHGSGNGEIAIGSSTSGFGSILFGDSASGAALYDGYLQYNHATQRMLIASNAMIGAVIHDGKMAAVGGSQYTPDVSFEVSGPLKIRNNTAGGISQTHTNMSVASSGKFIINFASIGTMTSGDTIVFTYNAVSWKSWFYKIRWSSTGGYMGELWAGGYNNNSNGYGIFNPKYRHTDHSGNVGTTTTDGATLTVTRSGQANTMTLTLNNTHVHPLFEIEYACGGGEGVPQASRASITVNS